MRTCLLFVNFAISLFSAVYGYQDVLYAENEHHHRPYKLSRRPEKISHGAATRLKFKYKSCYKVAGDNGMISLQQAEQSEKMNKVHHKKYKMHHRPLSDPLYQPKNISFSEEILANSVQDNGPMENLRWDHLTPSDVPDHENLKTVLSFALMAADAYAVDIHDSQWVKVKNYSLSNDSIRWQDHGLQGHIFVTKDESHVVMAIKGTSFEIISSSSRDKKMDCIMFSCCCGKIDWSWKSYCDCYKTEKTHQKNSSRVCSTGCLKKEAQDQTNYFWAADVIIEQVKKDFPKSTIWLTGHSLGGAISHLLSLKHQIPTMTFSTPPTRHYAELLGLIKSAQQDTSALPIWAMGNDLDPIFAGTCNGPWSSCFYAGYIMESKCRFGNKCVFYVKGDPTPPSNSTNSENQHVDIARKSFLSHSLRLKKEIELDMDSFDKAMYGVTTADALPTDILDNPASKLSPKHFSSNEFSMFSKDSNLEILQFKYDIRWHRISAFVNLLEKSPNIRYDCAKTDGPGIDSCQDCTNWEYK